MTRGKYKEKPNLGWDLWGGSRVSSELTLQMRNSQVKKCGKSVPGRRNSTAKA